MREKGNASNPDMSQTVGWVDLPPGSGLSFCADADVTHVRIDYPHAIYCRLRREHPALTHLNLKPFRTVAKACKALPGTGTQIAHSPTSSTSPNRKTIVGFFVSAGLY